VHRLAGRILTRLGRYQEASNRLRKAVALSDGDAGAYGELATALAYLGAVDEALEAARSACSLDPRRAPLLRWVEQIGQRQPDRATAA
jgi:Flp pilus assembly protein TadD